MEALLLDALLVLVVEEFVAGAGLLAAGWVLDGVEFDAGVEDVAPESVDFFDFLLFFACVWSWVEFED